MFQIGSKIFIEIIKIVQNSQTSVQILLFLFYLVIFRHFPAFSDIVPHSSIDYLQFFRHFPYRFSQDSVEFFWVSWNFLRDVGFWNILSQNFLDSSDISHWIKILPNMFQFLKFSIVATFFLELFENFPDFYNLSHWWSESFYGFCHICHITSECVENFLFEVCNLLNFYTKIDIPNTRFDKKSSFNFSLI